MRQVALLAAAVAAGVIGGFAAGMLAAPSPAGEQDVARLETEVQVLRETVTELSDPAEVRTRARAAIGPGRSPIGEGGARIGEGGVPMDDHRTLDPEFVARSIRQEPGSPDVSPEFVSAVRAAIEEIRRENAAESSAQKLERDRASTIREIEKRIVNLREPLGLDALQADELRVAAIEGAEQQLDARAAGASAEELTVMDREKHQRYLSILGRGTYREFRKLELDRVARPTIVSVASQAGVDHDQRNRIERLLDDHIEGLVDLEVRMRTEDLPSEERATIRGKMDEANRDAWNRLRNQILRDDQRDRVPLRLR